ncbi:STAS domain-containing protein [Streptomyces zhihengii]|uniref:Anti-sigma factor antagonist n=1 Tax=Streptomyces zhihengii TaxID=1818004 RepID=A0ABS2V234_9ACTN|nr:STAS domain-containing protein [Streptomyces zhihengii]MBM9623901.1 STAS domain-containing protein [Streptomyces zhihengii]
MKSAHGSLPDHRHQNQAAPGPAPPQCEVDHAVLHVTGELDMSTAPSLYRRGTAALSSPDVALILDLSQLSFCDSSGFNTLLRLRRRAQEARGLALVAPPEQVLRLLALCGDDDIIPVHPDLATAWAETPPRMAGGLPPDGTQQQ